MSWKNRVKRVFKGRDWVNRCGSLALLSMLSAGAHAEPCHLTLSRDNIEYGRITQKQRDTQSQAFAGWDRLSEREIVVTALCPTKSPVVFLFQGTAGANQLLTFGDKGVVGLKLRLGKVDDKEAYLGLYSLGSRHFLGAAQSEMTVRPGEAVALSQGDNIIEGLHFELHLQVTPAVKSNQWYVRDETEFLSSLNVRVENLNSDE